jgi:hypothetical protein
MKNIKYILNKIDVEEKTIEKIGKFLGTKRGMLFVSKLHTSTLKDLCNRYNCPKFIRLYTNDTRNTNIIKAAIKKYNIIIPTYTPIKTEVKIVKHPVRLKKEEIRKANANCPIKKQGFAALMHAYEEYKMVKYEKKNPLPDTKMDIFAEEIISQRNTQIWIHREYIRNFLNRVYGHIQIREPYYRVFMVYENDINHKPYEKEGDPIAIGYPLAACNEYTDIEQIKNKIRVRAKTIRDDRCLELKVYNKYGKLIAQAKTNNQR